MRWFRWLTLVWPGLTQLWFQGSFWGLAVGCGFGWLLSFAVISSFVWAELVDPWTRIGVWLLLVLVWVLSLALSFRQLRAAEADETSPEHDKTADELFRRAQHEYLAGNWVPAEQLLDELIKRNRKDIDSQLMLASLLRRTGQLTEAAAQLRRLEAIEGAEKWHAEIDRERKLLEEQFHPQATDPATNQAEQQNNSSTQTAKNEQSNQAA
ncbi:MAG TPA: hypothetical protein VGJ15_02905 [Pirellulales bacterium]